MNLNSATATPATPQASWNPRNALSLQQSGWTGKAKKLLSAMHGKVTPCVSVRSRAVRTRLRLISLKESDTGIADLKELLHVCTSWTTQQAPSPALHSHLGSPFLILYGLHHPPSPVATRRIAPRRPRGWRAELGPHLRARNDAYAVWCGEQHARLCTFQTAQGVSPALRWWRL